jgi:predicted regulator of Ras-like GTPase activity (Roadblock/LC7/MglB family)
MKEMVVPFKLILNEMMSAVPGASGAILADWEGEAVEQSCSYDVYDIKVLGAHKGILLAHMKSFAGKLDAGELEYAIVSTESRHVVIGPVGPDYILVMTLDRDAVLGVAVQQFKHASIRLYREIY